MKRARNSHLFPPASRCASQAEARAYHDANERRRVKAAPFIVVKPVDGADRVVGHAIERGAAEKLARAVGGRVVEQ